jgi:hypothetical protein
MKVTGIMLSMLDIPAEYAADFNRWYDLDHMPEHLTRINVIFGRRYVATPQLRELPGVLTSELTSGHPDYLTIHSLGGPVDFMSDEARDNMRATDRGIIKAGRYWNRGRPVYNSHWRVAATRGRASVHVSPEAIPHLPHAGVVVMIGQAAADRVEDAVAWWDATQAEDLLDLPGALAVVRYSAEDADKHGQLLHVLLCQGPVDELMVDFARMRRFQESVGRYPAHGGVYEALAVLPFQNIVPMDHRFLAPAP